MPPTRATNAMHIQLFKEFMGACFSSAPILASSSAPTAKVVALDGSLTEYSVPVTVSSVLGSSEPGRCFVCDSDGLDFDAYVSALGPDAALQLGRLYFVLPVGRLNHPLSGPDMASLAVVASSALARASSSSSTSSSWGKGGGRRRNNKTKISPVDQEVICEGNGCDRKGFSGECRDVGSRNCGEKGSRTRVNRARLSTIHEIED